MYLLFFIIILLLPDISVFSTIVPSGTVPEYFFSREAAFVAGEFWSVSLYWAGFARNLVASGTISERHYFGTAALFLMFVCFSKIIFTLPYAWIPGIFAIGLGALSLSSGTSLNKTAITFMLVVSAIILAFSIFILLGMGWFNFSPVAYYQYRDMLLMLPLILWHKYAV